MPLCTLVFYPQGRPNCILLMIYLVRTHYYQQGTQLYCAPTVDSRPARISTSFLGIVDLPE